MSNCEICNKNISGTSFSLEIEIQKNILTSSKYGKTKDFRQITGHYNCLKKYFDKIGDLK